MPAILQAQPDRTGIYVAVGVLAFFALVGLYFLLASRRDRARGRDAEEAVYVLGLEGRLVPAPRAAGTAPSTPLGHAGLVRLVHAAGRRGDMAVTHFVFEDAPREVPAQMERGSLEERRLARVVLSDSRGRIAVDADGRVTATPPLDGAVRRDLEAVFAKILLD